MNPKNNKFFAHALVEYNVTKTGMEIWADDVGDEYHTMSELYDHRLALNVALFNSWFNEGALLHGRIIEVVKSKLHNDGTMFPGYFIVMAITPVGQISYHYELKHWKLFKIQEVERTPPYDGHGSADVIARLLIS